MVDINWTQYYNQELELSIVVTPDHDLFKVSKVLSEIKDDIFDILGDDVICHTKLLLLGSKLNSIQWSYSDATCQSG